MNDDKLYQDAVERFESFGPEVPANEVPAAVRQGLLVMSFGYGDGPWDEEGFNALSEDDLEDWDDGTACFFADDWGPFRLWLCPQCDRPFRETGVCRHGED